MSMNNMGKPIGEESRTAAYKMLGNIGVKMKVDRYFCVRETAEALERDKPFRAQQIAMKYVDITGSYRLFAELLVDR